MVKIYGSSDDLVEIEGSKYIENEIDCYERDVVLYFEDCTIARIGYHKEDAAIWYIYIEKYGDASFELIQCDDENAEIYSDILQIDADIVCHRVIRPDAPTPEFLKPGQLIIHVSPFGDKCDIGKIKRFTVGGAYVYYSSGETAALSSYNYMLPIRNEEMIQGTLFSCAQ